MVSGTLYTYSGSFRANKILIAAAYSGSNVTVPDFEYGKTNTSPDFLKKFPLGKVPAFECNGVFLNESDAIAQYVSNDALLGGDDAASRAAVQEYISFTESEIVPSASTWVFPTLGFIQYNKQETEKAMDHLRNCFTKLNDDLLTKTFLVGERITLADITLSTALVMLYVQVLDNKFRASYGNLNRWFLTCINQPNFKNVLGDIKLCETMAVFDKKRYGELQKKADAKPKKQGKKQEKPKEQPKEQNVPKPVKVDYFADVPESNFSLMEWKEIYGKTMDVEVSQKWFEDNFDDKAFSMWYGVKEKQPGPKSNIISYLNGTITRTEPLRKNLHQILLGHGIDEAENKEDEAKNKEDEAENKGEEVKKIEYKTFQISTLAIARGTSLVFNRNEEWQKDSVLFEWKRIEGKEQMQKYLKHYFYDACDMEGKVALLYDTLI